MTRQVSLDGLRGTAILLVLLVHLHVMRGGYLGVDIFFVLSGYLITSLLLKEIERTRTVDFRRFYAHRARRLIPPLLICVLLSTAIAWYKGEFSKAITDILTTLFFVSDYVRGDFRYLWHSWSLSVEVQFYLIWPLILLLCSRLQRSSIYMLILILLVSILLWRLFLLQHEAEDWAIQRTYEALDTRCDSLLAGAAAAILVVDNRFPANRIAASVAFIVIVLAVLLVRPGEIWMNGAGFSLIAICSAYTIGFLACRKTGLLNRVFSFRFLTFFGKISYGLYLYHFPIMQFFHDDLGFNASFGAGLSIVFAGISWMLVEDPLLRRKGEHDKGPTPSLSDATLPNLPSTQDLSRVQSGR